MCVCVCVCVIPYVFGPASQMLPKQLDPSLFLSSEVLSSSSDSICVEQSGSHG